MQAEEFGCSQQKGERAPEHHCAPKGPNMIPLCGNRQKPHNKLSIVSSITNAFT